VFVDQTGRPYSEASADEAVTIAAATAGSWRYEFAPEGTGARLTMQGGREGCGRCLTCSGWRAV
jgi:hypothetical protein